MESRVSERLLEMEKDYSMAASIVCIAHNLLESEYSTKEAAEEILKLIPKFSLVGYSIEKIIGDIKVENPSATNTQVSK